MLWCTVDFMRIVSIKQLEARLSEYVRVARAGETVLVSDRDDFVAELGPMRRQTQVPGKVEAVLEQLAVRGIVSRACEMKKNWSWKPIPLGLSEQALSKILGH